MTTDDQQKTVAQILLVCLIGLGLIILGGLAATPASADDPTPTPTPIGVEIPLLEYDELPPPVGLQDVKPLPPAPPPDSPPAALAPALGTNFEGIGQKDVGGGFIVSPPDTHAATGPDRIVEVTNGHVGIYSKSGALLAGGDTGGSAHSLSTFCGASGCFDPKVIYDQYAGRFVAVALSGKNSSSSTLHMMVSKSDSPANLTTDWDKFAHSASATIDSTATWFDYPGLGLSPEALVVTGNMFSNAGFAQGTKIRVFDKTELYDGDATATFTDINRTSLDGGFTNQPAHHFGMPPAGTFYLFQRWSSGFLRVTTLTGVPGAPSVNGQTFVATNDQGSCVGSASQQGTSKQISTVCIRMMNAVWRNGSLWGTLTGADAGDSRAVVQWFEYDTNAGGGALEQHGVIDEGGGEHTYMPAIGVDACGNVGVTYTQSSNSRFPEMRYTGREPSDTLNAMQTPAVAKASAFYFDDFTGPTERWGDYASVSIDPVDQSFWVAHEFARVASNGSGTGRWGTWHANFTFGCGNISSLTIAKTAPASVTTGYALTYTLRVTSTGLITAANVVLTDTVPTSATLNVASLSGDATFTGVGPGSVITWTTGVSLTQNQWLTRSFVVTVDNGLSNGSVITNTGYVSASNTLQSKRSTVTTTVAAPELTVAVDSEPRLIQSTATLITYTIAVNNNGDAAATNLLITYTIPSSTAYVTGSASDGGSETAPASGVITWPAANLGVASTLTRTLQVTVTQPLTLGDKLTSETSISAAEGVSLKQTHSQPVVQLHYLPIMFKNGN